MNLFPAILATPTRYSTMPDEDDNNLYNGERGPAWRKYRRDMLSTARGKFSKNDKYSFKQAMLGTDEGGVDPAAPAMPAAAAALSMAQQKRIVRHGEAYKFVYDSIGEERLRNMLDAIDDNHADGLAKAAWDLIIRECDDPGDYYDDGNDDNYDDEDVDA